MYRAAKFAQLTLPYYDHSHHNKRISLGKKKINFNVLRKKRDDNHVFEKYTS